MQRRVKFNEALPHFAVIFNFIDIELADVMELCSNFGAEFFAKLEGVTWSEYVEAKRAFGYFAECEYYLNPQQIELLYKKFNLLKDYRQIELTVEVVDLEKLFQFLKIEVDCYKDVLIKPRLELLFDRWVEQGCPETLII